MKALIYLLSHFFYRLTDFFKHWYFDSFRFYSHFVISLLEKLDRRIALEITLRHLFRPLYQDEGVIGYILGFVFRTIRLILGIILYSILLTIALFFYLIWSAIPIYLVYKIIKAGLWFKI